MLKSVSSFSRKYSEIAHLTKGSGFTFGELSRLFQASSVQPSLTAGKPDELTRLSQFPGGLTQPSGLMAERFALMPDEPVICPTRPDVRLTLTRGQRKDVDVFG